MPQKIKINDIVTIVRKDNYDRSYQNELWTIIDFTDTHLILKAVKDRKCFGNAIIIVSAEYYINRVSTQAHLTDKLVTKPIDWTGCDPDIKACLQAGLAVKCIDEDETTKYITGYSSDAHGEWKYTCIDAAQMNISAKPLLKQITKTYYKKASEIIAWLEENADYKSPKWIEKQTHDAWTNEVICRVAGTLYEEKFLTIPPEWLETRTYIEEANDNE